MSVLFAESDCRTSRTGRGMESSSPGEGDGAGAAGGRGDCDVDDAGRSASMSRCSVRVWVSLFRLIGAFCVCPRAEWNGAGFLGREIWGLDVLVVGVRRGRGGILGGAIVAAR